MARRSKGPTKARSRVGVSRKTTAKSKASAAEVSASAKTKLEECVDVDASALFTVDTEGSLANVSRKSRRELARLAAFPPKAARLELTGTEKLKVAQAARRINVATLRNDEEQRVFDLWQDPRYVNQVAHDVSANPIQRKPQAPRVKVPKTMLHKAKIVPAVLRPHEGQSVNPESSAYEELACIAAAKEIEREREEEALRRKMKPLTAELGDLEVKSKVDGLSESGKVQLYRSVACADSPTPDDDVCGDGVQKRSTQPRIKSQARRNRDRKRKDLDARMAQAQVRKKLLKSVGQLDEIVKASRERDDWLRERGKYRKLWKLKKSQWDSDQISQTRRRFGRTTFAEDAVVVADSKASGKGLRSQILTNVAVKERLSSMVRRGFLPALPPMGRGDVMRRKNAARKLRKTRKFISPLLRDNSMTVKKK